MGFAVRKATYQDMPAIAALLAQARGDGLDPAERAARGFIQGHLSDRILLNFIDGTGVFVAVHTDEHGERKVAGAALTSDPAALAGGDGPPARTIATATTSGLTDFVLYGPVAVDPRFQGRGVVRLLIDAVQKSLSPDYSEAVLFVETANEKSLAVHRHLGMREVGAFEVGGRDYVVFAFALGD
ncbi:GNAT family N-acetyltransferase [Kutzneria sp. 744]|uniref:GNAT family N-acetyltransferase n=1 Tax=Kutzneria sp. (strain 744) TaxID=345341 RepID=UPI0003EECA72|nr:GNAT family N-acetyltransferase [Kutzneria sp. 744]EWM10898.1 acetyltransferase, GNAT family [Kutzneria sp. 744]